MPGQVIDAAMVDGAAALMTMTYTLRAAGIWQDARGTNLLDTGAHFYEVYETADGGFMGVGRHRAPVLRRAHAPARAWATRTSAAQMDRTTWPAMKERFAAIFATKTRAEWEAVFAGTDACAAPVLSATEAPDHPHNRARGTFTEVAGVVQPAPAPRFLSTPARSAGHRPPGPARRRGTGRLGAGERRGGGPAHLGRHRLTPTARRSPRSAVRG